MNAQIAAGAKASMQNVDTQVELDNSTQLQMKQVAGQVAADNRAYFAQQDCRGAEIAGGSPDGGCGAGRRSDRAQRRVVRSTRGRAAAGTIVHTFPFPVSCIPVFLEMTQAAMG